MKMLLKRLAVILISISFLGCSQQHVIKGDLSASKDINITIENSEGGEEIKKATATTIKAIGIVLFLGGLAAAGMISTKE